MKVDIGQYPKDRAPLIAGWLSDLGFKLSHKDVRPIVGGPRKQKQSSKDDAPAKRQFTGRYLVTLRTIAEAERLAREIHGRKYSVSSKLVRHSVLLLLLLSPRWLVGLWPENWSRVVCVRWGFRLALQWKQVRRCKYRPVSWGKAAN